MRPTHFDQQMKKKLEWRLERITSKGHHIYVNNSGARVTVDADSDTNIDRYLRKFARRDARRGREHTHDAR